MDSGSCFFDEFNLEAVCPAVGGGLVFAGHRGGAIGRVGFRAGLFGAGAARSGYHSRLVAGDFALHHQQVFNLEGARSYLIVLLCLAFLAHRIFESHKWNLRSRDVIQRREGGCAR